MSINDETCKMLSKLSAWYVNQCDGTWEHQFGIMIETTDNPGWWVQADVGLAYSMIPIEVGEIGKGKWIRISICDGKFSAAGDPGSINDLLSSLTNILG